MKFRLTSFFSHNLVFLLFVVQLLVCDCACVCACACDCVCVCDCLSVVTVTSEAVTDDKRLRARLATRNWQEDTYSTLPMAKRRQILQILTNISAIKLWKFGCIKSDTLICASLAEPNWQRVKCAEYFAQLTHRIYKPGNFPRKIPSLQNKHWLPVWL